MELLESTESLSGTVELWDIEPISGLGVADLQQFAPFADLQQFAQLPQ